jgi:hypothetical protein
MTSPVSQHTYSALLGSSGQVKLNSSGNGIASCGPSGVGNVWQPSQIAISTSSDVSTPAANLYLGPLTPDYALATLLTTQQVTLLGGSITGNNDSIALLSSILVPFGQALIVQWLGGDSGATAIMTVTGTQSAVYFR